MYDDISTLLIEISAGEDTLSESFPIVLNFKTLGACTTP